MKSVIRFFIALSLMVPLFSQNIEAITDNPGDNTLSISYTKPKSVTVFVGYGSFPHSYPNTYYYNDGLYSGVLRYSYSERRPGGGIGNKTYAWYVTYS